MNKGLYILFILTAFTMFTNSCYEPVEGCRDVNAVNYDVTADINCCCIYPRLVFNYTYVFDTLDYSQSTIIPDVNGAPYAINGFQLGFHNTEIISVNDDTITYSDTLIVDGSDLITSRFFSFLHSSTSSSIGLIDSDKDYYSLRFSSGMQDELKSYDREELMQNSSFIEATENLYINNKWYDGYVRYVPDTAALDSTITVRFDVNEFDLKFDRDYITKLGYDLQVGFTIDLYEVVKDFSVTDSKEMQREQLSDDWDAAITIDSL